MLCAPSASSEGRKKSRAASRCGFHFSEKYRPVTGPERPPRRQDLLTASLKLTSWITPARPRSGSAGAALPTAVGASTTTATANPPRGVPAALAEQQRVGATVGTTPPEESESHHTRGGSGDGGRPARAWSERQEVDLLDQKAGASGGAVKNAHINYTGANGTRTSAALASDFGGHPRLQSDYSTVRRAAVPASRRIGTYEREREERGLVLHYLRAATVSQRSTSVAAHGSSESTAGTSRAAVAAGGAAANGPSDAASAPTNEGTTAAALLLSMRERPWEGRPNAGSPKEWSEWLEQLEPTLERHLRWLTVDGLAARSSGDRSEASGGGRGGEEVKFSAVLSAAPDMPAGGGGQASAGRQAGLSAGGSAAAMAAAGGEGGAAGAGGGGSCVLTGQMRIMKSRPIKMVKPWR